MTKKGNYMADRFDTSDHGCPQISRKKHETNRKKDLKLKKTYGIINNCDILSD